MPFAIVAHLAAFAMQAFIHFARRWEDVNV